MKRKKRVNLDCDGVLTNFLEHCEPFLKKAYGRDPIPEIGSLLYHDCFAPMSEEQEARLWKQVDANPGWVRDMPLIPGTREALAEIRKMADEVVCVTSPHTGPHWVRERYAALQSLGFNKKTAIFTAGKHAIAGAIFIDDHPSHVAAWAEEWGAQGVAWLRVHAEYKPVPTETWPYQLSDWDSILKAIEEALR